MIETGDDGPNTQKLQSVVYELQTGDAADQTNVALGGQAFAIIASFFPTPGQLLCQTPLPA
jgi:hypothetical protein